MQLSNDQIKRPKTLNLNKLKLNKNHKILSGHISDINRNFNNKNMGGFTRHFVPYINHSINVHDTHFVK